MAGADTTPPRVLAAVPGRQSKLRTFRPDIEGLRAIAVLAVVLDHSGLAVHGGYIGVDVFFVISGFLITSHLFSELSGLGHISVARFYARRVRRILPAATLVIIATLLASWILASPLGIPSIGLDAITAALFCINYRLIEVATNYFSNHSPSPFQQYWSLAIEEQFYALWPLLLVGVTWSARRLFSSRRAVSSFLLVVIVVSLYESVALTSSSPSWAYFTLVTRAWELALGGLVAINAEVLSRTLRPVARSLSWVGFGGIVTAALWFSASTPYPGIAIVLPVTGAALVIGAGCAAPRGGAETLLGLGPFQYVGRISYSLYLWHWPVLIFLPLYLGHTATSGETLIAVAFSLVLASVSYSVVEQPFRRNQQLVTQPKRGLLVGAGLIGISVLSAVLVMTLVVVPTGTGATTTPTISVTSNVLAATRLQSLPANLSPPLDALNPASLNACAVGSYASSPLPQDTCVLGDAKAKHTVVLFGDSHASMWRASIATIAARRGWKLITYVHFGKAFVDATDRRLAGPTSAPAAAWNAIVFRRLSVLRPSLVIMTEVTNDFFGATTMTDMIAKLKRDGSQVVWIEDTPYPGINIPDCLSVHGTDIQRCSVSKVAALTLPGWRRTLDNAAARSGAFLVDPLSWFCTARVCPPVIANSVVYLDQDHITQAYALKLTPALSAALATAMPDYRLSG